MNTNSGQRVEGGGPNGVGGSTSGVVPWSTLSFFRGAGLDGLESRGAEASVLFSSRVSASAVR